jgi:polar amino acid transport system ATP-binding protein
MAFLHLQDVSKAFNGVHALKGVSLDVERGATVAIIGPSGCGKTTLLRCIALFEPIDQGSIILDSRPVIDTSPGKTIAVHPNVNEYRARVGMVFQHLDVWPHLTVMDNLVLAPRVVRRMHKKQAVTKAQDLLVKMGLTHKASQYPGVLSGGEQQRVAIARAMMMEPEILLLDEITSALDPEIVGDILDIIEGLTQAGITLLIVTHEMLFASQVADRIIFLDQGSIIEQGTPSEVFCAPKTVRLQTFLQRVERHRFREDHRS